MSDGFYSVTCKHLTTSNKSAPFNRLSNQNSRIASRKQLLILIPDLKRSGINIRSGHTASHRKLTKTLLIFNNSFIILLFLGKGDF